MMSRCFFPFLLFFSLLTGSLFSAISYKVEYFGIEDPAVLKTIKATIHLSQLKNTLPESIGALRYRADSDREEILKILQAYGYYEATLQIKIEERHSEPLVAIYVHQGPCYTINSFMLSFTEAPPPCKAVSSLGLQEADPLIAEKVLHAEFTALQQLSFCGYPLASIKDRSIVLDGDTKTADIHLIVDTGPKSYFGPITIKGNAHVRPRYIEEKLKWKEGDPYSREDVENTQKALMDSGLFSSAIISHQDVPSPDGVLPMEIEVAESKHRSVYGGVSYQTYYGPGVTFGWEHRNLNGMGRSVSLRGDLNYRSHSGVLTYLVPNFFKIDQDYVWEAEAMSLNILPYFERSYSLINRFEKRFHKAARVAFGLQGEKLLVRSSVLNGDYWLIEVPIFAGFNMANNLLNPTKGFNAEYKATPSLSVSFHKKAYIMNQFALSHYLPISPSSDFLVLAQQLSGGFFWSGDEQTVPVPKRFFGGSEEDLRGYSYYSVSPLSKHNKPIGGLSALYYTLETRFRFTKNFGLVPFFDMGNVSSKPFLSPSGKWLKSAGLGVRYFSFIGPFRADIGFPLNPRKDIDKNYRILLSIGQTF
jgi:translocation and assembly module TamA